MDICEELARAAKGQPVDMSREARKAAARAYLAEHHPDCLREPPAASVSERAESAIQNNPEYPALLVKKEISPNARHGGRTLLSEAVMQSKVGSVRVLLEAGAAGNSRVFN